MKRLFYIGRCPKCNKVTAASHASTVKEQLESAKDIKSWMKQGLKVELEEIPMDGETSDFSNWCDTGCK